MITVKQIRFCEEYLVDLNGTQAAIRAGYSHKTAKIQAARLLTNANLQEKITELRKLLTERTLVKAEKVIQELAKIAFSDIRGLFRPDGSLKPVPEMAPEAAAAIQIIRRNTTSTKDGDEVISITLKLHDKNWALEQLGRHLGIFEADNNQPKTVNLIYLGEGIKEEVKHDKSH